MKRLLLAIGLAATLLGSAAVPTFAANTGYTLHNRGADACTNIQSGNSWRNHDSVGTSPGC